MIGSFFLKKSFPEMGGELLRQKAGRRFTSTNVGLIRCHLMCSNILDNSELLKLLFAFFCRYCIPLENEKKNTFFFCLLLAIS
jgi:hypothetical protein